MSSGVAGALDLDGTHPRALAEERLRWEELHPPERAPEHVRELARALDHARPLARPFGARTRDRTLDRAHARAHARALTPALDQTLDRVGRLDRVLDHYLRRALDPARVVELAEAVGLDPADVPVVSADAAPEWRVASDADAPVVADPAVAGPAVDTVPPARSATCVLHGALRVLPVAARARYREELDSELAELAAAGRGRHDQLAYALRAAGRMASLRRALRTPGPRG